MLSSADQFVRLHTAGWITRVVRQVTSSLDHCFVPAAPRRVKLNRVGFTAVSGNEGLKVSVIGVVETIGLKRLQRRSQGNVSSVRLVSCSDLQPIDLLRGSDVGYHG